MTATVKGIERASRYAPTQLARPLSLLTQVGIDDTAVTAGDPRRAGRRLPDHRHRGGGQRGLAQPVAADRRRLREVGCAAGGGE